MSDLRSRSALDPFLDKYEPSELKIASEFLSTWLPFLSSDLCQGCFQKLSRRINSLDPPSGDDGLMEPVKSVSTSNNIDSGTCSTYHSDHYDPHINGSRKEEVRTNDDGDTNSIESWKENRNNDDEDTNSIGSLKEVQNKMPVIPNDASSPAPTRELSCGSPSMKTSSSRMSWADMAQEDELEDEEEEQEANKHKLYNDSSQGGAGILKLPQKTELPRDQREYIRFMNIKRKKDFICLERIKGKPINILQGLELHTGIFSTVEQKRIVDYVYSLQEMGRKGQLKERTFTAPQKWMRGKGRETIQFGCCYNYATDRNGNPPGILYNEFVDPIPHLFKVIIRRLVKWHVLPSSCVPDSCIVNIYEEGDCIPPHIDNHDFVRPFCTVSFLSECDILFGSNLRILGPGEFSGSTAISLPVGSVLVLNGNGADVAKHCVPAVPTKRISITFRRMDETKRPNNYIEEADLQGLEPLSLEAVRSKTPSPANINRFNNNRPGRPREGSNSAMRGGFTDRAGSQSGPRYSNRPRQVYVDRRRDT